MNDTSSHLDPTPVNIAELLGSQFQLNDFDLVGVMPVETHGDSSIPELQQYLIQIKPKRKAAPAVPAPPASAASVAGDPAETQQIYHPDGSLNIAFLTKNAELLVGCGEYALARNIYLKIAHAGNSATATSRALFALATCFEAENNLEEARARYEQSITFQPALDSYERLANLLIAQKKDKPAAEALERALNLKELPAPTRFQLLKSAGNCWMRAGEMAAAERSFKKALEVEPTADEIQGSLGSLYLQAGKITEARRKFQDTLAANPRNDKAVAGLAMCLLQEGMKREAHDQFARALELNLNNPQAIYHLVKCAYELKTYATAARIVENYIDVAPVNINLLYSLAGLQFHLGRMTDATGTVNQILQLNPNHTGATDLLRRIEGLSCHGGQGNNGH